MSAPQLKEQVFQQEEPNTQEKRRESDDIAVHDEKTASEQESSSALDVPSVGIQVNKEEEKEESEEEDDPTTPTATTTSKPFIIPRGSLAVSNGMAAPSVMRSAELTTQETARAQSNQKPSSNATLPSNLMPPPPRPKPVALSPAVPQRTPASAASTLRVPGGGPVPSRIPGSTSSSSLMPPPSSASLNRSLPRASPNTSTLNLSSLTASTLPTQKRKKVILSPGHSPIDWAHLIRTAPSTTLTGLPPGRQLRIAPSQLALYNGRKGAPAWSAWQGKVYNLGPYLPFHPGGQGELLRGAGKEGSVVEKMFMEVHPWVNWENMLKDCVVGVLVAEGEGDELVVEGKQGGEVGGKASAVESELDDMD